MKGIWQEAECPVGADWDLHGDEMVYQGQQLRCLYCGELHDADEVVGETYIMRDDSGEMEVRPLPADAEELAAWRSEFEPPQQECGK